MNDVSIYQRRNVILLMESRIRKSAILRCLLLCLLKLVAWFFNLKGLSRQESGEMVKDRDQIDIEQMASVNWDCYR